MSDAFADLWNSTGASKPAEAARNLGALAAATAPQAAPKKAQNDVFSMLAAAGSSSSVSSSSAQSATRGHNVPLTQKALSVGVSTGNARTVAGGDAFSGLLSGFTSAQLINGANLTMAQRAALAEKEKRECASQSSSPAPHISSAWAGLDTLGTASVLNSKSSAPSHNPLDDFGFGSLTTSAPSARAQSTSPQPPLPTVDDWSLGEFASQPVASSAVSSNMFDDLDDFIAVPTSARPPSSSPRDFDFGDREDGLLNNQSDDDDILGDLGRPVEHLAAKQSARNTPSPQSQSGPRSRAVSPPPHILGQIVEMGFSIQQARVALAATDTGLDVQAALETLLTNGAASSSVPENEQENERRPQREPGHERYYASDEEDAPPRHSQRMPTRPLPQADRAIREHPGREGPSASASSDNRRNLQEQADKFIAQASEIGLSMFNRANAFWKEGKERVQRAYDERAAASGSSRPNVSDVMRRDGRPRWMQDASEDQHVPEITRGFQDDGDVAPRARRPQTKQPPPRVKEPPTQQESIVSRMKVGNLFSDDDAPAVYVSPFRRKALAHRQVAPTPPKPIPSRTPSPIALVQRRTMTASQSAITASTQQKTAGTEKFKLGQYGEAEAFYTAAIAALPESHLLLVPLYNNRALTRLKNGDTNGAIEDCTTVIDVVGPSYHPAREAKVTREDQGASVDLTDAITKAWHRRAEAYEGKERWELAKMDWEALAGVDFAGAKLRTDAYNGIRRCRRMLNSEPKAAPASVPRQSVAVPARAMVRTPPSEALNRVREANEAAEVEDREKHELKDVVDARLAAWRAGKENNIRALIASLDTVLWPELGWQKVGIHELVSPSQVKIRYTKAIAKLHPDKLNVRNTTLEQRMVANGVFGSLNEAWNTFKP